MVGLPPAAKQILSFAYSVTSQLIGSNSLLREEYEIPIALFITHLVRPKLCDKLKITKPSKLIDLFDKTVNSFSRDRSQQLWAHPVFRLLYRWFLRSGEFKSFGE